MLVMLILTRTCCFDFVSHALLADQALNSRDVWRFIAVRRLHVLRKGRLSVGELKREQARNPRQ